MVCQGDVSTTSTTRTVLDESPETSAKAVAAVCSASAVAGDRKPLAEATALDTCLLSRLAYLI